jgi:tRNA A-37 threonylcarbamoyl transferase component Bud32
MDTAPNKNCCPKCAIPLADDAPQGLCPKCLLAAAATPTEAGEATAEMPAAPSLEEVRTAFPQLEILEQIGVGGMGVVFKARQPKLERLVALKLLSPSLAASPAFAERFNREARVLGRLNHPGIVSVYDFGEVDGFYFLLMEYVDGVNLRQAMRAGRFTPSQALGLVPRICEALQFAHDEGILHRDVKPENILLDAKGRVKIADFGIAKLVGEPRPVTKLTATGAAIGTPNYMAPEQIEHPEDVDQRADIYSLGVVFYEMLTGELPIGRFAPPSEKTLVDPRVDAIVFRALEREREKRYSSADEVKTSVENITATARPSPASAELGPTQNSVTPAVTPGWRSVWLGLSVRTRLVTKIAVAVLGFTLTYLFVFYRISYVIDGYALVRTGNVGWGTPWLSFWRSPTRNMAPEYGFDFFTFSFTAGLGAMAAWILLARLRAAERRANSPHRTLTIRMAGKESSEPAAATAPVHWSRPNWLWPVVALAIALVLGLGAFLLFGVGYLTLRGEGKRAGAPPPTLETVAADPQRPRVEAQFTLLAGQVATFEIVTRSNGLVVPVPSLSAYLIAREGKEVAGTFRWGPAPGDPDGLNKPWQLELVSPDGSHSRGSVDVPRAIAKAPGSISLWKKLDPDREFIEWAGKGDSGWPAIGLRIRTQAHGLNNGLSAAATGTTNWLEATSPK